MSNRKKPEPPKPEGFKSAMSSAPMLFCKQWEYTLDGGLVHLKFGNDNRTDASPTMPIGGFLEMVNTFSAAIANLARAQHEAAIKAQQSEQPADAPKSEEPKP